MSLLDAFALEPFTVNEQLVDSLLLEPDQFEFCIGSDPGADASGSPVCNGQPAVSLVRKYPATFTTPSAHGFSVGQAVHVDGVTPSAYNGYFTIDSIPSPTQFTYLMASDPGANASGSFGFGAYWQVGRQIIENNVIELELHIFPNSFDQPVGILIGSGGRVTPYVFGQVVIRGNFIRTVDNVFDSSGFPVGIWLGSCESVIAEDNFLNLNTQDFSANPILISGIGSAKSFNNQTPAGKLLQGYDGSASKNELATDAELALLESI